MPGNKIPLGSPLQLTDEELDLLAEVTEEDIEKARIFWKKHAPAKFKNLLDADAVELEEGE